MRSSFSRVLGTALSVLLLGLAAAGDRPLRAEPPSRPVVFLPGVLGSKLCEGDEILWGSVRSYRNFDRLILPLDPADTAIEPCGVVDQVMILGPIRIHRYDTLLQHLEGLGYVREGPGRTLYQLPYDWRQSNYDSARRMDRFVEATPGLRERKFDIVAHSMGGVVARIYLEELGGDRRVENLVTLGTPHRGSLKILRLLFEGFGGLENWLAGGAEEVRRVAFTFPSIFELLPAYGLCCIEVLAPGRSCLSGAAARQCRHLEDRAPGERCCPFEILDPRYWLGAWVPSPYRTGAWRERMLTGLERAEKLRELLARPVPDSVSFHPFAGDKIDTLSQLYIDQESGATRGWRSMGGDGTVLVTSASAGDRSQADVSFNKHAVIFRDRNVQTELGWKLLDEEVPKDYTEPSPDLFVVSATSDEPLPLEGIDLSIEPAYVATGKPVDVGLVLQGRASAPIRDVEVTGTVRFGEGAPQNLVLVEDPERSLGAEDASAYYGGSVTPAAEGTYTVRVEIRGLDKPLEEYFVALDPPVAEGPEEEEEEEAP